MQNKKYFQKKLILEIFAKNEQFTQVFVLIDVNIVQIIWLNLKNLSTFLKKFLLNNFYQLIPISEQIED